MHPASPAAGSEPERTLPHPSIISSPSLQLLLIGQFGAFALSKDDPDAVLRAACWTAAEGSGGGFARVLRHRAEEHAFVELAGVGWKSEAAGEARVAADLRTAAGLAWRTGQPVVSGHFLADGRFRVPDALVEHGIRRTVTVPVPGDGAAGCGVLLEVGSQEAGEFTQHDVSFLQALANCVAAAVGRQASRAVQERQSALAEERETALREFRHRTGNDLQRITALAEEEAWRTVDPDHRASLHRIVRHVLALAGARDQQPGGPGPSGPA